MKGICPHAELVVAFVTLAIFGETAFFDRHPGAHNSPAPTIQTEIAQVGAGQDTPVLHVYGPGGPLPAIKEAADVFGKKKHIQIVVTGGPASKWLHDA